MEVKVGKLSKEGYVLWDSDADLVKFSDRADGVVTLDTDKVVAEVHDKGVLVGFLILGKSAVYDSSVVYLRSEVDSAFKRMLFYISLEEIFYLGGKKEFKGYLTLEGMYPRRLLGVGVPVVTLSFASKYIDSTKYITLDRISSLLSGDGFRCGVHIGIDGKHSAVFYNKTAFVNLMWASGRLVTGTLFIQGRFNEDRCGIISMGSVADGFGFGLRNIHDGYRRDFICNRHNLLDFVHIGDDISSIRAALSPVLIVNRVEVPESKKFTDFVSYYVLRYYLSSSSDEEFKGLFRYVFPVLDTLIDKSGARDWELRGILDDFLGRVQVYGGLN